MSLQMKSLAIHAGATESEIEEVVAQLKKSKNQNLAQAQKILAEIR